MISFWFSLLLIVPTSFLLLRLFSRTSLLQILLKRCRSLLDRLHLYQLYTIPQYRDQHQHFQENPLYWKVTSYLNSLPSVEDSDYTNLLSGAKSNEIILRLDADQEVGDDFLGARLLWKSERSESDRSLVLKIRKKDKPRILRSYLQHILSTAEEIEQSRKEIRLFVNSGDGERSRWISVPLNHPATLETVAMDGALKNKVRSDLEQFLKSKQYYHRIGRVWRRSYLLSGASGTGKSSFAAAMARFLCYDVYTIDLAQVSNHADLRTLLVQTANRSLILVEHLDRFLLTKSTTENGMLNFIDGIESCCGEERVMVFTMNGGDRVDQTVMIQGKIDVHVHFPLCDFSLFTNLASSYLGVKDHKYFNQLEEIFQTGASLSPAEIGKIMISNRSSPTRALKSVLSALQADRESRLARIPFPESGEPANVFSRESIPSVKEFKKLYGLLRIGSRRREGSMDLSEKESSC